MALLPLAMIGVYAKPFERFLKNSCINSASISYSLTPGFTKFKTRRIPFSVISHAFCSKSNSMGSFTDRNLCKIGLLLATLCAGYLFKSHFVKRASLVSVSIVAL